MIAELRVWALIAFAVIEWAVLSIASLVTGNSDALPAIAETVPVLLFIGFLFERLFWRWTPLHPHVIGTPVLLGTWKGQLVSLWVDPQTKVSPAPKTAFLVVEQTLTTVSVRLLTDEATSDQVAGSIAKVGERRAIAYIYRGVPGIEHRSRNTSLIHFGGALLHIQDGRELRLEGEYWAERESKGTLHFDQHSPQRARSFEEAESLTYAMRRS
jgi:SMODS-associating 2TM, beta-strand rich effector domain